MSRRNMITFVVLGLIGFGLGLILIANNNPGTAAEILEINAVDAKTGTVLVCTIAGQGLGGPGGVERFVAQISAATEILDQRKNSPANLRALDLQVGQRVRIWTDGSLMESAPPQTRASRIIVLRNAGAEQDSFCGP